MTQLLKAEGATLEQWARHQGNYLARQLSFDLERAVPPRVQAKQYREWLGVSANQNRPMNLLLLQEHAIGQPSVAQVASMVSKMEQIFAVVGLLERYEEVQQEGDWVTYCPSLPVNCVPLTAPTSSAHSRYSSSQRCSALWVQTAGEAEKGSRCGRSTCERARI